MQLKKYFLVKEKKNDLACLHSGKPEHLFPIILNILSLLNQKGGGSSSPWFLKFDNHINFWRICSSSTIQTCIAFAIIDLGDVFLATFEHDIRKPVSSCLPLSVSPKS